MKYFSLAWATLASSIADAASAQTPCDGVALEAPGQIILSIDPFDGEPDLVAESVMLRPDSPADCVAAIELAPQEGSTWRLTGPGGAMTPIIRLGARESDFVGPLRAPLEANGEVSFVLQTDDFTPLRAGGYETLLQLTPLNSEGEPLADPRPLGVRVEAPARAQLYVAGAASAFGDAPAIDTIEMRRVGSRALGLAYLTLRANSQARVKIRSEHGGRLRHDDDDALAAAYVLRIDGEVVPLSTDAEFAPNFDIGYEGAAMAMEFSVQDIGKLFAGRYRDRLTIEIEPF